MAAVAGALVLNIGTLSRHWVDAMLLAGKAANAARRAGRARSRRRRRDDAAAPTPRGESSTRSTSRSCAATQAEVAALAGVKAEIRGVEAMGVAAGGATIARTAASGLGVVASVTGPVDHVSDGTRTLAIANGDPLLATITGSGCMSSALTGCFAAVREPLDAAAFALAAFGVAGEDAARGAEGPGTFHARCTTRSTR